MVIEQKTEFWLSGPIAGIIPMLQPVAHAILQAQREIHEALENFPGGLIWQRPAGVASVVFHLQHLAGVLDRLFTYARGEELSALQLDTLQKEGQENKDLELDGLLSQLNQQVSISLEQLQLTPQELLLETRYVGRKQIPSNVLGLLFHAAEHTSRHTGQLLVTARIVKSSMNL